jgi:hypothetical protein
LTYHCGWQSGDKQGTACVPAFRNDVR